VGEGGGDETCTEKQSGKLWLKPKKIAGIAKKKPGGGKTETKRSPIYKPAK